MKELESLFSASAPEEAGKLKLNSCRGPKPEKVQLVNHVFNSLHACTCLCVK